MKNTTFKVPIYQRVIKIVILEDRETINNALDTLKLSYYKDKSACSANLFISLINDSESTESSDYVLILKDRNNIEHEVFHLTCGIMRDNGDFLKENNEESYAYLNQYLNNKVKLAFVSLSTIEEENSNGFTN